jgi:ankyrin repeat protein
MKAIQDILSDLKRENSSDRTNDPTVHIDTKTSQIRDFLSQCSLETGTALVDPTEMSYQADLPTHISNLNLRESTTIPATRRLFLPVSSDATSSTDTAAADLSHRSPGSCTSFELQRWGSRCDDECRCCCHSRRSWNTPKYWGTSRVLQSVIGSLFLGYTGLPVLSTQCDSEICRTNRTTSIHVRYMFPTWLFYRTLDVAIKSSTASPFQLNVVVRPRVRWSRTNLFGMIDAKDFEGVQQYVLANPASVHAVWDRIASSPLHYAVTSGSIDINIIRLLVKCGSSLDLQNDFGLSATQHVSLKIFRKLYSPQEAQEMEQIFPISLSRGVDHEFSLVHKVVLGISPIDLESLLDSGDPSITAQLNHRDIFGNTPLHWASSLADMKAVRSLIRRGTDPNIKNNMGKTPLLVAASTQNFGKTVEIVKLLIELGSDPLPPIPSDGWGPFQWACHFENLALAELLLQHGADINQRSRRNGATSLIHAAIKGRVHMMEFLLEHGSEINIPDFDGRTPLYHALYGGHSDAVRLLTLRRADYTTIDRVGQSLLHCAAERGDAQMMELLTSLHLKGMKLGLKNKRDMTAEALFACRGEQDGTELEDNFHRREEIDFWKPVRKTVELDGAFHALIASVHDEQEAEGDIFFDALESIPVSETG